MSNTPFINLFYLRPALGYLFLDSLYESLSPGYQARRREQDYGQQRLWEPRA